MAAWGLLDSPFEKLHRAEDGSPEDEDGTNVEEDKDPF